MFRLRNIKNNYALLSGVMSELNKLIVANNLIGVFTVMH